VGRTDPFASLVNVVLGSSRSAMLCAYADCCAVLGCGAGALGAEVLVRGFIV
jgi:hypothetical protein